MKNSRRSKRACLKYNILPSLQRAYDHIFPVQWAHSENLSSDLPTLFSTANHQVLTHGIGYDATSTRVTDYAASVFVCNTDLVLFSEDEEVVHKTCISQGD